MRDLLLSAIIFGSLPFALKRPFYGLLMWIWLSIMNPHRLTYGFAYTMPFAQIVAVVTMVGLLINWRSLYRLEVNAGIVGLFLFSLWVCVSPLFSYHDYGEFDLWLRVIKIQLMVMVTFFVVGTRREIHLLALVLTFSIAFFGIKGGLFTILTGGNYRVYGPDSSFVADNNTLAVAIIMAIPLLRYLQMQSVRRSARQGYAVAMLLCVAAAVGSYSRGALLGLLAMGVFLWAKGSNKLVTGVISVLLLTTIFSAMPESWMSRMDTLDNTGADASAQGRINAWWMCWNLAKSRFPIGGGFNIYTPDIFARFAPVPEDLHAAHSIYFQVLGEHGFMGLALFLFIFWRAWAYAAWVVRHTRDRPDLKWAGELASMCQVSLIGYAVGGAFLSLTYYDFPYYVVAITIVTRRAVMQALKNERADSAVVTPMAPALPRGASRK